MTTAHEASARETRIYLEALTGIRPGADDTDETYAQGVQMLAKFRADIACIEAHYGWRHREIRRKTWRDLSIILGFTLLWIVDRYLLHTELLFWIGIVGLVAMTLRAQVNLLLLRRWMRRRDAQRQEEVRP